MTNPCCPKKGKAIKREWAFHKSIENYYLLKDLNHEYRKYSRFGGAITVIGF